MASHNTWRIVSEHFTPDEFECKCGCGLENMDDEFLLLIFEARQIADTPYWITSGCRCPDHNRAAGGLPDSAHLEGLAADIYVLDAAKRYKIVTALLQVGLDRIGIGPDFVHVDADPAKPPGSIWTY